MMASSSSWSAGGNNKAALARSTLAAAGTASDPVCLLDSDSDSDEDEDDCRIVADSGSSFGGGHKAEAHDANSNTVRGTASRRKRPAPSASVSSAASAVSSAASGDGRGRSLADRFVPFRAYTTSNDLRSNNSSGRAPFASTLREMVGLDSYQNHPNLGPLKFMVIFNYLIDFDFLLSSLPELASLDRTLVCYGSAMNPTGPAQWQSLMGSKLTTVRLVPSDPPHSANNPLPFRMEWGVHHTKMFLVGYESGMRVVIHTSNLRASDFENNAQMAYVQDFPVKAKFVRGGGNGGGGGGGADQSRMIREHCDGEDSYALSSPFEEELIRYLDTYRQTTKYVWPLDGGSQNNNRGSGGMSMNTGGAKSAAVPLLLTEVLRRYDYSAAYGVLVPSVPGYHKLRNCPWGHLRLREAIRAHTSVSTNDDDGDDNDDDENTSSTGNILLQFSSLGSISLRWLHELASSMDVRAARAPLRRLPTGAQSSPLLDKIQIVWPTFEEIRTAAAGYAAGGPIPGRVKNTDRPFLRRFYHRWSSTEDVLRKGRHPGHCKTFLQLSGDDEDGSTPTEVEWCLVTSHNLSTAALGQIQNNSRMGEQCLFIRHWELGVFFSPDTLKGAAMAGGSAVPPLAKKLKSDEAPGGSDGVGAGTETDTAEGSKVRMVPFRGVDAQYEENDVVLPLPFDVKPTRYSSQDVPWATDRRGGLPDAFGRVLG